MRKLVGVLVAVVVLCFLGSCKTSEKKDLSTLKVSVFDSVGGAQVGMSHLKVFSAGSSSPVYEGVVQHGKASLLIEKDRFYDFELEGEKGRLSGSKIVGYYVGRELQELVMLQFPHGMVTRGVTPPSVVSVKDKGTGKEITDGFEITNEVEKIIVEFSSVVGGVEPFAPSNFGAKIAFGSIPNFWNGIKSVDGQCEGPTFKDGSFITKYEFDVGKVSLPEGDSTLVIVGYDLANNRVEKHIGVKCARKLDDFSFRSGVYFNKLLMYADRYPYYMGIFGANDETSFLSAPSSFRDSYYRVHVSFSLKKPGLIADIDVPITGFDLFRRKKDEIWQRVAHVIYQKDSAPLVHQVIDGVCSLQEGEKYEYKVVVFNNKSKMESPIMNLRVLPSFTYKLTSPENYKELSLSEADDISYSCILEGENFPPLDENVATFLNAGLLIVDKKRVGQFASRFTYSVSDGDVKIRVCGDDNKIERRSLKEMITNGELSSYGITDVKDLIEIKDGKTLIIKPKLVKIAKFNVLPRKHLEQGANEALEYKYGASYEWDIQAEYGNPLKTDDDEALHIVKVFEYDYGDGRKGHTYARSFGNNSDSGSNAINGRFVFSITK